MNHRQQREKVRRQERRMIPLISMVFLQLREGAQVPEEVKPLERLLDRRTRMDRRQAQEWAQLLEYPVVQRGSILLALHIQVEQRLTMVAAAHLLEHTLQRPRRRHYHLADHLVSPIPHTRMALPRLAAILALHPQHHHHPVAQPKLKLHKALMVPRHHQLVEVPYLHIRTVLRRHLAPWVLRASRRHRIKLHQALPVRRNRRQTAVLK